MLNIGNKVFRNLQEQVGYNTKCIKEIGEVLDGLVVEDHLVIVSDPSGTLSEEDLSILGGNLAFMYYDGAVYIKTSETLTEITFKKCELVATEVSSTYFTLGMSKITVTISTRAYVVSVDSTISIYSKNQMDSLLALKVNDTDLLNKTYPVGSIYMSVVNTSPAGILGGNWESLGQIGLLSSSDDLKAPVNTSSQSHTFNTQVGVSFKTLSGNNPSGSILSPYGGYLSEKDGAPGTYMHYLTFDNLYAIISPSNTVYAWKRVSD